MNSITLDNLRDIQTVLKSPFAKFITFSVNECGYYGSARDLNVNWTYPMFLKFKSDAIREDIPNWWEAMNSTFDDDYWKATCKEVKTLQRMIS